MDTIAGPRVVMYLTADVTWQHSHCWPWSALTTGSFLLWIKSHIFRLLRGWPKRVQLWAGRVVAYPGAAVLIVHIFARRAFSPAFRTSSTYYLSVSQGICHVDFYLTRWEPGWIEDAKEEPKEL